MNPVSLIHASMLVGLNTYLLYQLTYHSDLVPASNLQYSLPVAGKFHVQALFFYLFFLFSIFQKRKLPFQPSY
ncbi:hypothetical protein DFH27DRAFT_567020 [Peziza echinospora]|nr:hypothetical protein DFH27DRAFT_567020 [Peziza echinospora]